MWSGVELRELRVFLTVAEELHFGRAAERLQLNRSRVSQIINTLEARLGARMFERTSRRVSLTSAGEHLLADIEPHYRGLQRALEQARNSAAGVTGALRIGIYTPICMGRHAPEIVRSFQTRHPGADVAFVNIDPDRDYLDWLRAGEVDLLASRLPLSQPDLTIGPILSREERVLLVGTHDRLGARKSVSAEDYADRAIADVADFPREAMDAFTAVMRVAIGAEVYPTVARCLEYYSHPDIVSIPITDLPPCETALVWLTANQSPKIEAFAAAAADVLSQTELATHQPRSAACGASAQQKTTTKDRDTSTIVGRRTLTGRVPTAVDRLPLSCGEPGTVAARDHLR